MHPSKLSPLRNGLLEFLILDIVSSGDVYVADILGRLADTDFATREGTLYPLLSRMRREGLLDYDWRESTAGTAAEVLPPDGRGTGASRRVPSVLGVPDLTHRRTGKVAMDKTILIGLSGHSEQFRLDEGRVRPTHAIPRPGRRSPAGRSRPNRGHRRPRALRRRQAQLPWSDPTTGSSRPRTSMASSRRSARSTPARIRRRRPTDAWHGRVRAVGYAGSARARRSPASAPASQPMQNCRSIGSERSSSSRRSSRPACSALVYIAMAFILPVEATREA